MVGVTTLLVRRWELGLEMPTDPVSRITSSIQVAKSVRFTNLNSSVANLDCDVDARIAPCNPAATSAVSSRPER